MKRVSTAVVVMLVATGVAFGQGRPSRYTVELSGGAQSDVEVAGDERFSVSLKEAGVSAQISTVRRDQWNVGVGFRGAWTQVDFDGPTDFDRDLFEIGIPISLARPLNRSMFFRAILVPKLASDLEAWDENVFDGDFIALVTHRISRDVRAAYGVMYTDDFGAYMVPVAGIEWDFVEGWTLDLIMPRVGVRWVPREHTEIDLFAELRGGEWRVHGDGETEDFDFSAQRVHAGLGFKTQIARRVALRVDAGVSVLNELEFRDGTERNVVEPDAGFVVRTAIEVL